MIGYTSADSDSSDLREDEVTFDFRIGTRCCETASENYTEG